MMGKRPQAPPGMDLALNVRALATFVLVLWLTVSEGSNYSRTQHLGLGAATVSIIFQSMWYCVTNDTHPSFDGAALDPEYQPPKYTGPEPTAEIEGGKLYTGSCHCGVVTVAVKTLPLDDTYKDRLVECNCSICERVSGRSQWTRPRTDAF
jgi:hypothetical protein